MTAFLASSVPGAVLGMVLVHVLGKTPLSPFFQEGK
jgi:hypothetical protein